MSNFFLFFLFMIPIIKTQNSTMKAYDEQGLIEFIKNKFLNSDKPDDIKKIHYMIVDPDEYLKSVNLVKINKNLELLYKEFNITTFIYIVNAIQKNRDLNYKLKDFSSLVFSEIYAKNPEFDQYTTISAIFQVEDQKMNIRLGSSCRNIIYDSTALTIINKREKDLKEKKLGKLFEEFTKELLDTYRKSYKTNKNSKLSFIIQRGVYILISISSILVMLIICYYLFFGKTKLDIENIIKINTHEIVAKTSKEKKIKDFINKQKNKKIKTIMENTCIICLENFIKENDIKSNVLTGNSDEEDTTSNNINNIPDERITIPCDHSFHTNCILNWFKQEKRCPICRTKFDFYDDEEKKEENENVLNIKNYNIDKNLEHEDNNLLENINNFVRIQKMVNPDNVNEEFCSKIISYYEAKRSDNYEIIKINK